VSHINVTMAQINTKRHWRFAATRMKNMLESAAKAGATILTLNEISKEQALYIKKTPGWDIAWTINDHLPKGGWGGNAVAWKRSEWEMKNSWASAVSIDYRPGTLRNGFGRPIKKTINQACVSLRNKHNDFPLKVMAFHFPTEFNDASNSRERARDKASAFAKVQIRRGVNVILGGDGNNIFPKAKGLQMADRDGPDATFSSGKVVGKKVLKFKRKLQSDHNGLLAVLRFDLD